MAIITSELQPLAQHWQLQYNNATEGGIKQSFNYTETGHTYRYTACCMHRL